MSGTKSGVAKQICDIKSRAVFTHCYGNSLNSAASDVLKQSKLMKDALDITHKITQSSFHHIEMVFFRESKNLRN